MSAPPFLTAALQAAAPAVAPAFDELSTLTQLDRRRGDTLGTPLPVFMLPTSNIKAGTLQQLFDGLTRGTGPAPQQIVYPVVTAGAVRSSFELAQHKDATWGTCCLGETTVTQQLTDARQARAAATGLPVDSFFALTAPVLGAWFIAAEEPTGLTVVPVADVGPQLEANVPYSLAAVGDALRALLT